ncbi:hypothetical protein JRQ81_008218 [Phrynocephalus forsythii]|uniref:Uncharacterized protein n=1 Tax=Phrynocephalus forsythii TaxID=171643 RepID=A0A9Q0XCD2_9SAUR|nr:hypothetical protein JRQ81_008218 [Phrynocephalus forsythii]
MPEEKQRRREKATLGSPRSDTFRPSALFTYTPQKWNPTRQIHFARVGGFPLVRRVNPGAFRSSSGSSWAPPPDRRAGCSALVAQSSSPAPSAWLPPTPASPAWSPPSLVPLPPAPDPCARETVVKALDALMACRKRPKATEEGSPPSPTPQESKRRRQDSTESGQPAFEPVVANGAPASQVPKPGTLKRGPQLSPPLEDSACKKSCPGPFLSTGGPSPRPVRNNCIYSSYSSSGGIEQLWKRRGVRSSSVSSQDSSCSESPARLLGKGPPLTAASCECSLLALGEKAATPTAEAQLFRKPTRQCKWTWPPPVELGYKITVADYNADRLERLKQFRRGLDSGKDTPPPTEEEAASSAPSDGSPPRQENQKDPPEGESSSGQAGGPATAAAAAAAASLPPEASPMPLGTPAPSSLAGTPGPGPAGSQPGEVSAQPVPPPPPSLAAPVGVPPLSLGLGQPAGGGTSSATPFSSSSSSSSGEPVQTPGRPSSAAPAKPSLLFGILTSPLGGQPSVAAATAATTASPAPSASAGTSTASFPLVFGTPSSTERSGLPAGGTPLFKPLFGAPGPPASTASPAAVGAPSLLAFPTSLQPAAAPGQTSSGLQGFSAPSTGLATPLAGHTGAASVTTVSASRAMFSLGPSVLATTAAVVAAASPSLGAPLAPQPSRFGVPSGSAAASPLFPFGSLASTPGPALAPLASSPFGQPPPGTAKGAHGPTGFGSSVSQVAPAAPLAVTTQSPFGSSSPAPTAAGLGSVAKPLLPSGANGGVPEGQPPPSRRPPGWSALAPLL